MNPIRSCLPSFSIFILVIVFSSKNVSSQQTLCINSAYNPQVDRGYAAILNSLLSSLSSNASAENNANNYKYYNSTAGVIDSLDVVYGLYLCRGDVNKADCATCVQTASKDILTDCPNDKSAIVWNDNCLLRYSNQSAFPDNQWLPMSNPNNSTDPERFNDFVGNMMNELATQASSDVSGEYFSTLEGKFSAFEKFFSLAQCVPNLSSTDCDSCLRQAITQLPNCCNGKQGGRILKPNCNIRYETYQFYTVAPPPPAPAPELNFPASNVTRPPNSNPPEGGGNKGMSVSVKISIIVLTVVAAVTLVVVVFVCLTRKEKSKKRLSSRDGEQITTVESLNYSLIQVQNATNNFSEDCKIGQGGFGHVYKGKLPNGEEVAVKRLSQNSVQGLQEFKNEIVLLAKLQHRNLVRLLGFCFENKEMILIYEFFRNKSLDHFLFDPEKRPLLGWSTRYKIIEGIARGLLYLHEDSRLRIIHRDLKASNVLLDENMNAKIADFGTAKLFQIEQSEENTRRIAGTYGYMAPEYAIYGQISVKSDVFSFGVLLMEIISGQKNNTFYQSDGVDDLLSYAWKNFKNGNPLALLDPSLGEQYSTDDVIRCIHIGLLCVQEDAESRPTMASIVLMLSRNSVTLSIPLQPAFFATSRTRTRSMMQPEQSDTSSNKSSPHCVSGRDVSFTELYPR